MAEQDVTKTLNFLRGKTFYLATVEDGKPKNRPFASICEFEGRLYFETGNFKNVYKQMLANPYVSLCVSDIETHDWLRLEGHVVFDDRIEAKQKLLDDNPVLIDHGIYTSASDPTLAVFYIDATSIGFYKTGGPYTYGNELISAKSKL